VDKANTDGTTALYFAANEGHTAIVAMLLKSGADKSIRGWVDETPLEAALDKGHAAIVALLRA
jgi:ankyrin repeat protein